MQVFLDVRDWLYGGQVGNTGDDYEFYKEKC